MFPLKDNIPTRRFPVLTVALIVANVVVFLFLQNGLGGLHETKGSFNVVDYGAIPYEITHPGDQCDAAGDQIVCEGQPGVPDPQPPTIVTLFTAMFMHGGILHIVGNMLFLWIFGNNIEDSMSRWRFLLFYLAGGLVATAAQTAIDPNSAVPTIGASGAVAAVLGAYLLLYPRARVVTVIFLFIFFTFVELPAMLVLGFWFLLQLFYTATDLASPAAGGGGGVAYMAHVGGFVFGLLLIRLIANKRHDDPYSSSRVPVY